jgi:hypothetical protein
MMMITRVKGGVLEYWVGEVSSALSQCDQSLEEAPLYSCLVSTTSSSCAGGSGASGWVGCLHSPWSCEGERHGKVSR